MGTSMRQRINAFIESNDFKNSFAWLCLLKLNPTGYRGDTDGFYKALAFRIWGKWNMKLWKLSLANRNRGRSALKTKDPDGYALFTCK